MIYESHWRLNDAVLIDADNNCFAADLERVTDTPPILSITILETFIRYDTMIGWYITTHRVDTCYHSYRYYYQYSLSL